MFVCLINAMADVQESGGATEVLTWGTMSIFLVALLLAPSCSSSTPLCPSLKRICESQHKKTYASPGVKMEFKDRQLARDFKTHLQVGAPRARGRPICRWSGPHSDL